MKNLIFTPSRFFFPRYNVIVSSGPVRKKERSGRKVSVKDGHAAIYYSYRFILFIIIVISPTNSTDDYSILFDNVLVCDFCGQVIYIYTLYTYECMCIVYHR